MTIVRIRLRTSRLGNGCVTRPQSVFENCQLTLGRANFEGRPPRRTLRTEISFCMGFNQTPTDDTDESNDEIRLSNDELMTKQPALQRLPPGARINANWKEQKTTDYADDTDAKGFLGHELCQTSVSDAKSRWIGLSPSRWRVRSTRWGQRVPPRYLSENLRRQARHGECVLLRAAASANATACQGIPPAVPTARMAVLPAHQIPARVA